MEEKNKDWKVSLFVRGLFTLIGFLLINWIYYYQRYDLIAFLSDYPNFPYSSFPKYIIPILYPILFFVPVLVVEHFLKDYESSIKMWSTFSLQIIISILFFYLLWYLMVHVPSYPSLIAQEQITYGFLGF